MIISELTNNTLHIVRKILFYSPQYFYNHFTDFIYLNCSTMDVIHVHNMRKKRQIYKCVMPVCTTKLGAPMLYHWG